MNALTLAVMGYAGVASPAEIFRPCEAIEGYVRAVRRRNTIAVGDGLNGLETLRWAKRGVVMGHAPEQVVQAADEVTGTLEEDGAAAVLRSLLLETVPAGR